MATYEISAKDHGIGSCILSSCQDGHCLLVKFESITHNSDLWFVMKAGQKQFWRQYSHHHQSLPHGGGLRQWNGSQINEVADAFAEY